MAGYGPARAGGAPRTARRRSFADVSSWTVGRSGATGSAGVRDGELAQCDDAEVRVAVIRSVAWAMFVPR